MDALDELQNEDNILLDTIPGKKLKECSAIYTKRIELYKKYPRNETDRAIKVHIYSRLELIYSQFFMFQSINHLQEIDNHLQQIDNHLQEIGKISTLMWISIRGIQKHLKDKGDDTP